MASSVTSSNNQSGLGQPRGQVLVNGTIVPGFVSADIHDNSYGHASTFEALVMHTVDANYNFDFWMNLTTPAAFEAQLGQSVDGNVSWVSVLIGQIDSVEGEYFNGTIELKGRDNTSLFIDNKVQATFANQTPTEIVTKLAQGHGLSVDAASISTLSGAYYHQDHTRTNADQFSKAQTEWDLILYLAKEAGCSAWVTGTTLHFQPQGAMSTNNWPVQLPTITYGQGSASYGYSNIYSDFKLTHDLTKSTDIKVTVESWHTAAKANRTAVSKQTKNTAGSTGSGVSTRSYVLVRPGLTQDQAQALANSVYHDLARHEYTCSFSAPGDLTLTAQSTLSFPGQTGSLAQTFYVDSVDFKLDRDDGLHMAVTAKNLPPSLDVSV